MVSTFLFDAIQKLGARTIGPKLRSLGLKLYKNGVRIGGSDIAFDTVLPKAERVAVGEIKPTIGYVNTICQGTTITGNVNIAEDVTIQFHTIIQASVGSSINIAKNASIGDLVVIKADQGKSVSIGENALIASNAYLRNCKIGNDGVVCAGTKIYDDCVVEGMLGAGAVLLEGETVPEGEIWAGSPAVYIRKITDEERTHNADLVHQYSKVAEIVVEEMEIPIEERLILEMIRGRIYESQEELEQYRQHYKISNEGLPFADEDYLSAKRIFDIENIDDHNQNLNRKTMTEDYVNAYEGFPKNFNNHKANYRVHNELKGRVESDSEMQRPDYSVLEKSSQNAKPDNFTRKY